MLPLTEARFGASPVRPLPTAAHCWQVTIKTTGGKVLPEVCFGKTRPRKDAGRPGPSQQRCGARVRLTLPALPWEPDPSLGQGLRF